MVVELSFSRSSVNAQSCKTILNALLQSLFIELLNFLQCNLHTKSTYGVFSLIFIMNALNSVYLTGRKQKIGIYCYISRSSIYELSR